MNEPLPVLLPCPGRPACPAEWFDSPGHQHFMRAGRRVRVRRLVAGCWEVLCPCCRERPVVAQVGTWERAMRRAGEHVREVHGAIPVVVPESEQQLHARRACPGWEYATTEGPRKQWDDQDRPPCDENGVPDRSWERNTDAGREGWERFDYTEESYWRRRRGDHQPRGQSADVTNEGDNDE